MCAPCTGRPHRVLPQTLAGKPAPRGQSALQASHGPRPGRFRPQQGAIPDHMRLNAHDEECVAQALVLRQGIVHLQQRASKGRPRRQTAACFVAGAPWPAASRHRVMAGHPHAGMHARTPSCGCKPSEDAQSAMHSGQTCRSWVMKRMSSGAWVRPAPSPSPRRAAGRYAAASAR